MRMGGGCGRGAEGGGVGRCSEKKGGRAGMYCSHGYPSV